MSTEQQLLNKIKNRYLFLRGSETALLALGVTFFTFAVADFFSGSSAVPLIFAVSAGLAIVALRITSLSLYRLSEKRITSYLNHHYPQLEASADLLLYTEDLSTLQHLQKSSVYQKLRSLEAEIHFPHHIRLAVVVLLAGIGIWVASGYYQPTVTPHSVRKNNSPAISSSDEKESAAVTLNKISITVQPPAYTQAASATSTHLPLKVIEGSLVKWNFQFDGTPANLSLIFSGKDSVQLKSGRGTYTFQRTISDGGFYQFAWTDGGNKIHQSDYFPIEVIKDEAPRIAVENLAQFIELKLTDRLIIDLKATLSDDFGLKDSHIIATVSKGSGESVKFREETLRFFKPSQFSGKIQQASRSIDIMKLGLEPGDELYFYIEAFDNKIPSANKSRTETFFIALQDTASYEMTEDQGLGVDLMPEYFRSQRQIIIDSEKLLEEKKEKKIKKEDFNSKSNELGYDQKVLRLRYGQFMGEEAESGIGIQNTLPSEEDEKAEDVMKKFGHTHDTENEHNLVGDKKQSGSADHDHDHKAGAPQEEDKNPMAAFTHSHDNADEATFFEQSIKTKLKVALTLMWDAELYLRMYQPEQSLPYQYKILKLLKEISNDSRVYVHRSGFDPPPLKEEKRLSGDLTELKNSFHQNTTQKEQAFPAIRQALITLEALLQKENPVITAAAQTQLQKAGNELAGVAVQQPGAYLKSLSLLKSLITAELEPSQMRSALITIRESFWKVLPPETVSPAAKQNVLHSLDQQFLQQLEELKHER